MNSICEYWMTRRWIGRWIRYKAIFPTFTKMSRIRRFEPYPQETGQKGAILN